MKGVIQVILRASSYQYFDTQEFGWCYIQQTMFFLLNLPLLNCTFCYSILFPCFSMHFDPFKSILDSSLGTLAARHMTLNLNKSRLHMTKANCNRFWRLSCKASIIISLANGVIIKMKGMSVKFYFLNIQGASVISDENICCKR